GQVGRRGAEDRGCLHDQLPAPAERAERRIHEDGGRLAEGGARRRQEPGRALQALERGRRPRAGIAGAGQEGVDPFEEGGEPEARVPHVRPLVLEAEVAGAELVQQRGPVNLIRQVGGVELLDRAGERAEGGEVRAHRVGVEGAESPVVGHGAGEAAVGWVEMPLEVEVRPAEVADLRHQRGSPRSSLWSPMEAEPANDSTTTSLPSMERVSVAPRIRAFRPTSVWESVLSVTSVPASRVTLGPMVLRSTV